jgi:hypothetical protein
MKACDCLVRCGDDPRLAAGKATPCERSAQLAAKSARNSELHALAFPIARRWALEVVQSCGEQVLVNGHVHHKTLLPRSHPDAADLKVAARYLLLADAATPHPTRANLLRIKET